MLLFPPQAPLSNVNRDMHKSGKKVTERENDKTLEAVPIRCQGALEHKKSRKKDSQQFSEAGSVRG